MIVVVALLVVYVALGGILCCLCSGVFLAGEDPTPVWRRPVILVCWPIWGIVPAYHWLRYGRTS